MSLDTLRDPQPFHTGSTKIEISFFSTVKFSKCLFLSEGLMRLLTGYGSVEVQRCNSTVIVVMNLQVSHKVTNCLTSCKFDS